jgi:hypothetical protein
MPNSNDETAISAPYPTDQELLAALGRANASGDKVTAQRIGQMLLHNSYRSTQPHLPEAPGVTVDGGPPASRQDTDYLGMLKYLAQDAVVNVASGIDAVGNLPRNLIQNGWDKGMDKAANDMAAFQAKYGPSDPSDAVVNAYGDSIAPAVDVAKSIPEVRGLGMISDAYGSAVDELAAQAGHADPRLSGAVGAIGHSLPMLLNPETLLGKYAGEAAAEGTAALRSAPKPSPSATDPFPLDSPLKFTPSDDGRVHLNSTPGALEREGEAARRSAAPVFTKSTVPTSEVDLSHLTPPSFSPPDNAISVVAHDPETGQLVGHSTFVPRGNAMQSLRMDVDPAYRGIGVGPALLQDAVGHAHGQGMDFLSDSQVSIPAARTYEKLKGVNLVRNPDVDHIMDETDGQVGRSQNGQPVYSIPAASHADDALEGEPEPNSWIASQAYAEGGGAEMEPVLGGLSKLAERFATRDPHIAQAVADHAIEKGGITYHPTTSTQPTAGYAVTNAYPGREAVLNRPITGPDVHSFITKNADVFGNDMSAHFGAWKNGDDWYMDVAHIDPDLESALGKAKDSNQQAIYDLGSGQDIPNPHYQPPQQPTPSWGGQPSDKIRQVAEQYMQQAGLPYNPPKSLVSVDPNRSRAIAQAYEEMQHAPNDPKVAASYQALIRETMAQYQAAKAAGLKAEFIPPGSPDPYGNPRNVIKDIHENNHMWVFPTDAGFGSDPSIDVSDNPLLGQSGESFNGIPATHNDIFRVVHDYFGHAKEGNGFRANGEENAWLQHSRMYSPEALPAMTSETRGQNSWVNFGPHAEANRGASGADTIYAPQKVGLLPDQFTDPDASYGSGVPHFADGGPAELDPVLGALSKLGARYAARLNPQAEHLAERAAEAPSLTYNPTTGDLPHEGYLVPQPGMSMSLDSDATPGDFHDFMLQHQDAFENPKAVIHAEKDPNGNGSFLHVAIHEPDFEGAMAAAQSFGAPGVREIHTGKNFSAAGPAPLVAGQEPVEHEYLDDNKSFAKNALINEPVASRPLDEYDRIHYPPQQSTPWTPGRQTVTNPVRNYAPGIYGPTKEVVDQAADLASQSPENPMMRRLFGVTRQDLADIGAGRQGNLLGQPKGYKRNPEGSQSALNIMTPQNAQRLVDALDYARTKPELSTGMTGWYVMDPAYQRILHLVGDEDQAKRIYDQLNTYQAISSPQTPVDRELNVAGTAHWLKNAGRWSDYQNMVDAGKAGQNPADIQDLMTHVYHNSQNVPAMNRYNERGVIGSVPMDAPKAYVYGEASNVPEIGNQTRTPVGDTHFSSAVGLLDTRTAKDPKGSVSTEELQTFAPWFRSHVADRAGYESVPAQANLWGIFAPQTGVRSGIGMPKLELMTQEIQNLADRAGVSPETARDMYLLGQRP